MNIDNWGSPTKRALEMMAKYRGLEVAYQIALINANAFEIHSNSREFWIQVGARIIELARVDVWEE